MAEKVVITGGTGLVGMRLSELLSESGYSVVHLSRTENLKAKFPQYKWDLNAGTLAPEALDNASYIIHLAGANVSEGKWTEKRKKAILDSRVKSGNLLFSEVKHQNIHLKAFIAASATGYYGAISTEQIFKETDPPATDFLGSVCKEWEASSFQFNKLNIRTVALRTGVVLTPNGGALKKLITPVKLGAGAAAGTGKQYMPWIHLDELCCMYIHAMKTTEMSGAYNAITAEHCTNTEFTRTLAKVLKRPFWPFKIPSFMLKLMFGEMSVIVLEGSRIDATKIQSSGYKFRFPYLKNTLEDLLKK
ncbi:MAG: TIGR01777 family oxidoreductase [Flavobacteriales bacterium]